MHDAHRNTLQNIPFARAFDTVVFKLVNSMPAGYLVHNVSDYDDPLRTDLTILAMHQ